MLDSKIMRPTALGLAIAMGVSGCASFDQAISERSGTETCVAGAILGGLVAGGITAATGGDTKNILVATTVGASAGCGLAYFYKQRVDRLKALAAKEGLSAQVAEVQLVNPKTGKVETTGVQAQIEVQEMFATGQSNLTDEGYRKMSVMAQEFARDRAKAGQESTKKVLVVGHSDATGTAEFNQKLSEARARYVGEILAANGIPKADIYFQGAGSSRPLADNSTADGRAKNRRVEFVEVDNETYLAQRVREERANAKYLAHGTSTQTKVKPAPVAAVSKPTPANPVVTQPETAPATPAPAIPSSVAKPAVVQLGGKGGIDFEL